jgi:hypothetical protein
MASLSCHCGKVLLQLTTNSPRVSTECCCDSCFDRVQFLADRGGPFVVDKNVPIVTMKWENKVEVVKGRDHLFAYKLTPDTHVVNIASKCCHTFLLGRNNDYDASCLTTNEASAVYGQTYQRIEPSSRWWVNQWSEERRAKLMPLVGIWVDKDGNLAGETGWKHVFDKQFAAMNAPIATDGVGSGESFDQVLQSAGPVQIVSRLNYQTYLDSCTEEQIGEEIRQVHRVVHYLVMNYLRKGKLGDDTITYRVLKNLEKGAIEVEKILQEGKRKSNQE